jgi:hypothetical protein
MCHRQVWAALVAGCVTIGSVQAEEVGIASFNIAWAGTAADFKRHVDVCSAPDVQWCDTRAKTASGATAPTPAEETRAKQCPAVEPAVVAEGAGGEETWADDRNQRSLPADRMAGCLRFAPGLHLLGQ